MSKPQRRGHAPLSGGLEGSDQSLYSKGRGYPHNLINWRLPTTTPSSYNTSGELLGDFFWIGFQEPKSNKLMNEWMGKSHSLGGSVELAPTLNPKGFKL
jgi:hypothetical protein